MKAITRIEELDEGYLIHFDDDTNTLYRPNPFEMWLVKQILAIKNKVGA